VEYICRFCGSTSSNPKASCRPDKGVIWEIAHGFFSELLIMLGFKRSYAPREPFLAFRQDSSPTTRAGAADSAPAVGTVEVAAEVAASVAVLSVGGAGDNTHGGAPLARCVDSPAAGGAMPGDGVASPTKAVIGS